MFRLFIGIRIKNQERIKKENFRNVRFLFVFFFTFRQKLLQFCRKLKKKKQTKFELQSGIFQQPTHTHTHTHTNTELIFKEITNNNC